MSLKYQWQEPLAAAIIEFYSQHLDGKLEEAEEAIHARFQELANNENTADERRALHDGLSLIRSVRKEGLKVN
jgi:hypothetical protein